ncbi:MAG: ABC transporter ATP-binding protein [Deltaproteobacteria bacterium]|nr:ABC transporter ATP-binding protein [Deltaproteobacteria bacterium]
MYNSVVSEDVSKKYVISKYKRDTQFREAIITFLKTRFLDKTEKTEEIWALKNISFSLKNGETVGIIGNNGAGKSTVLKILSRITYPTSGRIKINGRVASLLEVGTGFHDELTGRENVYLNGSILGMKRKEVRAKLDRIVDFADVEKFLDTPIKRYSSGMRMRLGFSVAAHLDTDILFIDEVLSVGDAAFQKKCLGTMGDMRNSGKTVIFVSHHMPSVENLCPRVIWIDKGEIKRDGPGTKIIEEYLSQYDVNTMDNSSKYDLRDMPNREGSGEIRYTGIEFMDMNEQLKTIIRSGENLKIRIHYEVHKDILNPNFYFTISNEKGAKMATFGNAITGDYINKLIPGRGYVDIDIDSLNVMPDRYFFNMWISGDRKSQIFDRMWWCARMDVEYSNYYNTGKGIDKELGYMFMPYKCFVKYNSAGEVVL